jgi:multidrug efflux pump subunit AcrB
MDGPPAADSDQRAAGGQGGSVLGAHHRGRFRAAVHHAGSRGSDFRPHGAHLWLRAGGSLDCHLHGHARARFLLAAPEHVKEAETIVVRVLHRVYNPTLRFALNHRALDGRGIGTCFLCRNRFPGIAPRLGSEFLPHLEEGNFWIRASMPITLSLQDGEAATRKMREILLRHPEVITVVSQHGRPDDGSDASPFSNVELFAPLKPFDEWPKA